jgi:hypothetical protein
VSTEARRLYSLQQSAGNRAVSGLVQRWRDASTKAAAGHGGVRGAEHGVVEAESARSRFASAQDHELQNEEPKSGAGQPSQRIQQERPIRSAAGVGGVVERSTVAKVQRRVIKHTEGDEEVDHSALLLGEDARQDVVSWEHVTRMLSPETETLVGHSSGSTIDKTSPQELATEIVAKTERGQFYNLQIAACKTGKVDEGQPKSFAELLKTELATKDRAVRVTAPKGPLWIAGSKKYVQPKGPATPQSKPEWKQIASPKALDTLNVERAQRLVSITTQSVQNWLQGEGNKPSVVIDTLKSVASRCVKPPDTPPKNCTPQAVLQYIDAFKTTTRNGRPIVDVKLREVIKTCGGKVPSPADEMRPVIDLYTRAYDAVLEKYPTEFASDDTFGASLERWVIEANMPLITTG